MRPSNRSAEANAQGERGSATLEFLTVGLILLVPLVYLVVAMAQLQAAVLAVEGAARQAARVYVLAGDDVSGRAAAARAVRVALSDSGMDAADATVDLECRSGGCLDPGARVRIEVATTVTLPLLPPVLGLDRLGAVPVSGVATQTVSRFASTAESTEIVP